MEWSSDWLGVLASTFCVRTDPLTIRGGVRFEVGWAVLADVLVAFVFGAFSHSELFSCSELFRDFWRPFMFVFVSVTSRRCRHTVLTFHPFHPQVHPMSSCSRS